MNKVENSIHSAVQFSTSVADKILEICTEKLFQPFKYAKLSSFGYVKVFNDGKWLIISHNKQWIEYFFNQAFVSESFQESIFNEINNNVRYLLYFNKPDDLKIPLYAAAYDFNMWQGFNIYTREKDFVEYCYFHSNRESSDLSNFYLNNIRELEHFILYFKSEAFDIIDTSDSEKLAHLRESVLKREEKNFPSTKNIFFDQTPVKKFFIKGPLSHLWLSKQEAGCAYYLSIGKSMKEIGRILNISPRTVESYISNIKNKTNCHSKSDLIDFFRTSDITWLK